MYMLAVTYNNYTYSLYSKLNIFFRTLITNLLQCIHIIPGWWFRTCFIFPYIGNVIIPTDELHHFSEGVGKYTTNQIFNGPRLISMAFLWTFYGISKGFYIWPTGISVPSERIAICLAWMKKLRSAWGPSRSCRVARPLWRSRWNWENLGKTENQMGNQLGSVRHVKNERWEMIEKIILKLNC